MSQHVLYLFCIYVALSVGGSRVITFRVLYRTTHHRLLKVAINLIIWLCLNTCADASICIPPHKLLCLGLVHETMVCAVIWPDCFEGQSSPGGICPESGPLSLTCSITTMLGTLPMIDTYYICSHWYIFPSKWACKACFPILLAQCEIPASRSMHPSRWLPPFTRKQNRTGVTRLSYLNYTVKWR